MRRENILTLIALLSTAAIISISALLIPISKQSRNHNNCVKTTSTFLTSIPGFKKLQSNDLNAMSVSLCNGSTPQKQDSI